jgi:hypothetical protein
MPLLCFPGVGLGHGPAAPGYVRWLGAWGSEVRPAAARTRYVERHRGSSCCPAQQAQDFVFWVLAPS